MCAGYANTMGSCLCTPQQNHQDFPQLLTQGLAGLRIDLSGTLMDIHAADCATQGSGPNQVTKQRYMWPFCAKALAGSLFPAEDTNGQSIGLTKACRLSANLIDCIHICAQVKQGSEGGKGAHSLSLCMHIKSKSIKIEGHQCLCHEHILKGMDHAMDKFSWPACGSGWS